MAIQGFQIGILIFDNDAAEKTQLSRNPDKEMGCFCFLTQKASVSGLPHNQNATVIFFFQHTSAGICDAEATFMLLHLRHIAAKFFLFRFHLQSRAILRSYW